MHSPACNGEETASSIAIRAPGSFRRALTIPITDNEIILSKKSELYCFIIISAFSIASSQLPKYKFILSLYLV